MGKNINKTSGSFAVRVPCNNSPAPNKNAKPKNEQSQMSDSFVPTSTIIGPHVPTINAPGIANKTNLSQRFILLGSFGAVVTLVFMGST